ncbi:DNA polymerase III subunit beta [Sneathiella sp.]|uniref:DNA polymerase III subunit beta n=1 Tax=Sneathiella sp. TaxID=1964365 RepID=UPI002FE1C9BA
MKIKIKVAELKRVMKIAGMFTERRSTILALTMIKFTAEDRRITVSATDLDSWADICVDGEIEADGSFLLPLRRTHALLSDMPGSAEVSFSAAPDRSVKMSISGMDMPIDIEIVALPTEDYPARLDDGDMAGVLSFKPAELLTMFDRVRFAISTELTRYYLNGVHWRIKDDKLISVATDGHRLAMYTSPFPIISAELSEILQENNCIIPRGLVESLVKILPKCVDETITVSLSESKILIKCEGLTIIAKLIDGTYPDYERVIPAYVGCHPLTVNRGQLHRFASLSSKIIKDRDYSSSVKMVAEGSSIDLEAKYYVLGHLQSRLAVSYAGKAFTMGFNPRYMAEILKALRSENVTIHAEVEKEQSRVGALIKVTSEDDPGFLAILMPMRLP